MKLGQPRIVILTGAGISAESGVPTFRGADGLWEGHRIEEVASPGGFEKNPELVQRFYNLRRATLATVEPNAAHLAIARLEAALPGKVTLITQNVDDLHERAGSVAPIHMHGELKRALCVACGKQFKWTGDLTVDLPCPGCGTKGGLRPDIVWFGEMPMHMERIENALCEAGVFAAIGTSGQVYPAAGFVHAARLAGAQTIEINSLRTRISDFFDRHFTGPATVGVPRWVNETIGDPRA